jgi:hypothetical protein
MAIDLVVDRERKAPNKHPVESEDLDMDARLERQRVDVGEKRIEKILSKLLAVPNIEYPPAIKIFDCGR